MALQLAHVHQVNFEGLSWLSQNYYWADWSKADQTVATRPVKKHLQWSWHKTLPGYIMIQISSASHFRDIQSLALFFENSEFRQSARCIQSSRRRCWRHTVSRYSSWFTKFLAQSSFLGRIGVSQLVLMWSLSGRIVFWCSCVDLWNIHTSKCSVLPSTLNQIKNSSDLYKDDYEFPILPSASLHQRYWRHSV